jgi:peptidoglycan/LPS O-acetylase OafA/YrhL
LNRTATKASALFALLGIAGTILIMMVSGVAPALSLFFYPCAIAAIWYGAGAKGIFSTRPFQAVGRWSYSIYLLHVPLLAMAQFWTGSSLQGAVFSKVALVILVIAFAALTYRLIERPAMTLRIWRAPALAPTS